MKFKLLIFAPFFAPFSVYAPPKNQQQNKAQQATAQTVQSDKSKKHNVKLTDEEFLAQYEKEAAAQATAIASKNKKTQKQENAANIKLLESELALKSNKQRDYISLLEKVIKSKNPQSLRSEIAAFCKDNSKSLLTYRFVLSVDLTSNNSRYLSDVSHAVCEKYFIEMLSNQDFWNSKILTSDFFAILCDYVDDVLAHDKVDMKRNSSDLLLYNIFQKVLPYQSIMPEKLVEKYNLWKNNKKNMCGNRRLSYPSVTDLHILQAGNKSKIMCKVLNAIYVDQIIYLRNTIEDQGDLSSYTDAMSKAFIAKKIGNGMDYVSNIGLALTGTDMTFHADWFIAGFYFMHLPKMTRDKFKLMMETKGNDGANWLVSLICHDLSSPVPEAVVKLFSLPQNMIESVNTTRLSFDNLSRSNVRFEVIEADDNDSIYDLNSEYSLSKLSSSTVQDKVSADIEFSDGQTESSKNSVVKLATEKVSEVSKESDTSTDIKIDSSITNTEYLKSNTDPLTTPNDLSSKNNMTEFNQDLDYKSDKNNNSSNLDVSQASYTEASSPLKEGLKAEDQSISIIKQKKKTECITGVDRQKMIDSIRQKNMMSRKYNLCAFRVDANGQEKKDTVSIGDSKQAAQSLAALLNKMHSVTSQDQKVKSNPNDDE